MNIRKIYTFTLASLLLAFFTPATARAVFGLDSVREQAGKKVLDTLLLDLSGLKYKPVPPEVVEGIDVLCAQAKNVNTNLSSALLENLVGFVLTNATKNQAWTLPEKNDVAGAMCLGILTNTFEERRILSSPLLHDHAFYDTLRLSEVIAGDGQKIYEEMFSAPEGFLTRDYTLNYDCVAPDKTSGAYYCYTNVRLYVQGKVLGKRTLMTGSIMTGTSDIGCKGAEINPQIRGLYFYSEEPGLNIAGAGWMETRMEHYSSFTLSIEISSNVFAFANFSWLSAGWHEINVLRSHHIYAVLVDLLADLREFGKGNGLDLEDVKKVVAETDALDEKTINEQYKKYCDYCREYAKGGIIGMKSPLQRVFNEKALTEMPLKFRRALLLQEKIRNLQGQKSWSAQK